MRVIVTGTALEKGGGISYIIPEYLTLLSKEHEVQFYETFFPRSFWGKFLPWLLAFFHLIRYRVLNGKAVHFSHSGPYASLIRESVLARFSRLLGNKTVIHVHFNALKEKCAAKNNEKKFYTLLFASFNKVILLTNSWESLFRKEFPSLANRCCVIPNPIRYREDFEETIQPEKPYVLIITRLVEKKNVQLAIEAFSELTNRELQLRIAGSGPYEESLRSLVVARGLSESVIFEGWVDGERKNSLLNNCSALCSPSDYEAFSVGWLEAMICGKPVITLDSPPCNSVINSEVGYLFSSSSQLSNIFKMINDNPKDNFLKGRLAKKYTASNFSHEAVAKKLNDLISLTINKVHNS